MWGIIPAACLGSRIQPLACSKELLPVGRRKEDGLLKPKAVSEQLLDLYNLWCARERSDMYFGSLVNAYLEKGGSARAIASGKAYFDVGTLDGYRNAMVHLDQETNGMPAQERHTLRRETVSS